MFFRSLHVSQGAHFIDIGDLARAKLAFERAWLSGNVDGAHNLANILRGRIGPTNANNFINIPLGYHYHVLAADRNHILSQLEVAKVRAILD